MTKLTDNRIRLVYPFLYDTDAVQHVLVALKAAEFAGRRDVWEPQEPHGFYRNEIFPRARSFLFGDDDRGRRYHRLAEPAAAALLPFFPDGWGREKHWVVKAVLPWVSRRFGDGGEK